MKFLSLPADPDAATDAATLNPPLKLNPVRPASQKSALPLSRPSGDVQAICRPNLDATARRASHTCQQSRRARESVRARSGCGTQAAERSARPSRLRCTDRAPCFQVTRFPEDLHFATRVQTEKAGVAALGGTGEGCSWGMLELLGSCPMMTL